MHCINATGNVYLFIELLTEDVGACSSIIQLWLFCDETQTNATFFFFFTLEEQPAHGECPPPPV